MRSLVLAIVALLLVGCSAYGPGATLSGRVQATAFETIPRVTKVALASPGGDAGDPETEALIAAALAVRGVAVDAESGLLLVYLVQTTPSERARGWPDLIFAGTVGSSGNNDFGIGLDIPILGGPRKRQTRYLIELALKAPDEVLLWRGRATGLSRADETGEIVRRVLPELLRALGRTVESRSF